MTTVNNQQWGLWKSEWKRNLIIAALILLPLIVLMSQQSIVYSRVFQFRSNGMALEPNTAASVYDSQLVTMANIHCSSNEIQSYPDGESMTAVSRGDLLVFIALD